MSLCSLICKKIGMSQVFSASGKVIAVTLLDVEENIVISARTDQSRTFLQIASFAQKAHRLSKSVRGMYKKISSKPQKVIKQFTVDTDKNIFKTGDVLSVKCLKIGSFVDISGKSIGKGYSGVMKKYGFKGLEASHGVSASHRSAGSTGQCQDPGKVFKGKKMAGRYGGVNCTVQNVEIVDVDEYLGLLVVKGSIPGAKGGYLFVRDAVKRVSH